MTNLLILLVIALAYFSDDPGSNHPFQMEPRRMLSQNTCDLLRDNFAEMLLAHSAPGGMILSQNSNCEGVRYFEFNKKEDHSLVERLDLLVEAVSTYKWSKRDGVVNLEPRDVQSNLLDTRVARFVYNTNSDPTAIISSLKNTTEFSREMESMNLRDGLYFGGLQSPPSKKPRTEVVLLNKSVREILNDIVQQRGRGLWVYKESVYGGLHRFTLEMVIK